MKAKDLIKLLSEYPEYEVKLSVDVSTGEEDYDRRAFGTEITEVVQNHSRGEFDILAIGELNY